MSGIPVYTQSPINASIASGTSPQTSLPPSATSQPASVTTTAASTSSYPPAQPGAAAFLVPTSAPQQQYKFYQPTTTKKENGPQAPQAGPVPVKPGTSRFPPPAPAVVEEHYHVPQRTTAPIPAGAYAPQLPIPPLAGPDGSQQQARSMNDPNQALQSHLMIIPSVDAASRASLEHPPGYYQNIHASELTNKQIRAQETNGLANNSSDVGGASGLDTETVWNTAKRWATQAGDRISEAEAEVWRRITKE